MLQARIDLERTRIFFGLARGNMLSMMAGAAMVAGTMHAGGVPLTVIGLWGLLFNAACGGVLWFEHRVQQSGIHAHNHARLLPVRIGIGSAVALFYGVAGWMLPNAPTHVQDTLLFIILSTVVTIGNLSFSVMPAHYLGISAATMGPLMAHYVHRYLMFDDTTYLVLLLVAGGWLVFVLSKTRAVSRTAIDAIALNQQLHHEIEEHQRTREAMRIMAMHDALTELGNRRYFDQVLKRSIANARRGLYCFGLVALDLDDFKPVNDQFGHATGDALLQSVARRLKDAMREGDFCARLGGDEFALLLFGPIDHASMAQATAQLRARFEAVHQLDGVETALQASASIGWAVYPDDGEDFASLMGVADARMYSDKQSRKAQAPQP